MAYGDHKKDAYLELNPKGKVPAVRFDDGDVLTEAAAILSWLGATYGTGDYARDTKLGRMEAEALSYMTSEVHATYGGHFATANFADSDDAQEEVKKKTYEKLQDQYQRLNENLKDSDGGFYLGRRSFADAFLYVLTRWLEQTPLEITDYPALKDFRTMMEADESVQIALKRQDMEPIG